MTQSTAIKAILYAACFVLDDARPARAADLPAFASYYGHGERLAKHTSNGDLFNPNAMTCAHRTLPFGTKLKVTYGGKSIVVRVTDRGPAANTGRSLDLTYGAARAIGLLARGVGKVIITILN